MPETPFEELRAAATRLRERPADGDASDEDSAERLADLLAHLAEDMRQRGAVEGSASKAVHPTDFVGLGTPREDWTAALAVARAINGGAS